jgi:hypothetical protein
MPTNRTAALVASLLAVLLLAASGCGGGGSSAESTTDTSTVAVDTTSTETDADAAAMTETGSTGTDAMTETESTGTDAMTETDTGAMTTEDEADSSTGTTDLSALGTTEDCQELSNLSTELGNAFGGTPSSDTEEYGEFLQAFADRAPEEIRDDFQVIADFYGKWLDAMRDADFEAGETPTPEQIQKLTEIVQSVDPAKLTAASANISTCVTENCVPGAVASGG